MENTKIKMLTSGQATVKVHLLRREYTDNQVADLIGISKNTLYKRLTEKSWKKPELASITMI